MSNKIATRSAFGEGIVSLGEKYKNIVVLDADLAGSLKTVNFSKQFPDRHFDFGVAEASMTGAAAGFALRGKIPFICTFAVFATGRVFDQIRCSICYPNLNVKIIGSHAGIFTGEDGATHQATEDIALMRSLPNMKVFCPADAIETKKMLQAAVDDFGPAYIRLGRGGVPVLYDESYPFEIGKGNILREGKDIAIFATGTVVSTSLEAASALEKDGISAKVVNISTIKPIDEDLIVEVAKKVNTIFTVEDHSVFGGLGSAICEVLSENYPKKVHRIGMTTFGESGKPADLYKKYGFDGEGIYGKIQNTRAQDANNIQ